MNNHFMIKKIMAISLTMMLTLAILLSVVGSVMAHEDKFSPGTNRPTALPLQQGPTDPAELEAFMDELFAKQLEEHHIAGAAVSVVKDGQLLFAKGYGYADLENSIPVDPEQTVFRIGSVGKLFTWTAVMQLVEQGKLDLEADINTYLDFHIPDTYPEPIRLKHLMTHTAGFEDIYFETLALDADDLLPVGEWLASHIPARVRPPGDAVAYSNYGTELAGYIVERVTGQSYAQYLREQIYDPLGMANSSALFPELQSRSAVGYTYANGVLEAIPDFIGQIAMVPAGAHASSVTDMARFMIAHLQDGRYSDENTAEVRILKKTTAQQMHGRLYTADPRLQGSAHGFFELSDNGQRVIGHSGSTLGFRALLLLLPDQNLGVFVAYNSETGDEPTRQHFGFQRAFFDHYYPASAVEPINPPADFKERAGRFEGTYILTASGFTTIEKFRNLMGGLEISDPGDGTLLLKTPWGEWRFVEVEPLYFRQVDGPYAVVFREDGRGRITHLFMDVAPQFGFEKLNWYETTGFNMALILGCILIFLSIIPVASIQVIRNRRLGGDRKPASRGARAAVWVLLGICVLNLLFVAGNMLWGNPTPHFGISMNYRIVLGLGVISAALTFCALVYTVLAWKNSYWGTAARVYYTLVTVAAVGFVWFLNTWNLLGWRF